VRGSTAAAFWLEPVKSAIIVLRGEELRVLDVTPREPQSD